MVRFTAVSYMNTLVVVVVVEEWRTHGAFHFCFSFGSPNYSYSIRSIYHVWWNSGLSSLLKRKKTDESRSYMSKNTKRDSQGRGLTSAFGGET